MSAISDGYVFNTDTQLKASWQPEPTEVTQIQITYDNRTSTWRQLTVTDGNNILETLTPPGHKSTTGKVLTIIPGRNVYVKGSGGRARFVDRTGHCDIPTHIAAGYHFEDDGTAYGDLARGEYGAKIGPTSYPGYPPQPVTLVII